MAFPGSHQARTLANRGPMRCPVLPAQPQHPRVGDLYWDHLCVSTIQTLVCRGLVQPHAQTGSQGTDVPGGNAPDSAATTRTSGYTDRANHPHVCLVAISRRR